MDELTIEHVDVDGAIRESAEAVEGDSRAGFLATAAKGAAGLVGGGALLATFPGVATAASKDDIAILNFALTLEYLERDFYAEALKKGGAGKGRLRAFAQTAHKHESPHVNQLKAALGRAAIKEPKFNFRGTTSSVKLFGATAVKLEDTGVKAYKGQAPFIQNTAYLKVALSIHTVEANHAAWVRHILGLDPVPQAIETPLTKSEVLAAVSATHFIV